MKNIMILVIGGLLLIIFGILIYYQINKPLETSDLQQIDRSLGQTINEAQLLNQAAIQNKLTSPYIKTHSNALADQLKQQINNLQTSSLSPDIKDKVPTELQLLSTVQHLLLKISDQPTDTPQLKQIQNQLDILSQIQQGFDNKL